MNVLVLSYTRDTDSHEARKSCHSKSELPVVQTYDLLDLCTLCGRFLLRLKRMASRIDVLRAFWTVVWTIAWARRADNVEIFVSTTQQATPVHESGDEDGC